MQRIGKGGFQVVGDPYQLGEVSFHAGWTFHRADGNATFMPREVFTIIYIDEARTCSLCIRYPMTALLLPTSTRILLRKTCCDRIYAWSSQPTQVKRLMWSDGSPASSQGKSVHHTGTPWSGLPAAMHSCGHVAAASS